MTWWKVAQLALVHVGVSITVVPVTSTLNRIMIADMGLSAFMVALLVALPYLLSPLQVFIGSWADRHSLWGRHRSPWMILGGLMAAFGGYLTAHAAYLMHHDFGIGLLAAAGTFMLWGVGVNVASVSYLSLVTDLTVGQEHWRSRAISVMWTAMILSTIATSLLISRLLAPYIDILTLESEHAVYTAFGVVWLISSLFVLLGSSRIEGTVPAHRVLQNSAENPLAALHLLSVNPSARRFFVYLLLVLISIHAQDVLLEPFGAEALGMSAATTARLTAIWGVGVFLTLTSGILIIRRAGKKSSANFGALLTAGAFGLIIVTGLAGSAQLFMVSVLLLGMGGGLMTISNLSFMLDMTIPQAAGLYIGAWGVANFAGQALGNIVSGLLRDLFFLLTGNVLVGYSAVFVMEIVGLLVAVWLFREISVSQFRRDAEVRLADVLAVAGN